MGSKNSIPPQLHSAVPRISDFLAGSRRQLIPFTNLTPTPLQTILNITSITITMAALTRASRIRKSPRQSIEQH